MKHRDAVHEAVDRVLDQCAENKHTGECNVRVGMFKGTIRFVRYYAEGQIEIDDSGIPKSSRGGNSPRPPGHTVQGDSSNGNRTAAGQPAP